MLEIKFIAPIIGTKYPRDNTGWAVATPNSSSCCATRHLSETNFPKSKISAF